MILSLGIFALVGLVFVTGLKYLELLPFKEPKKEQAEIKQPEKEEQSEANQEEKPETGNNEESE